MSTRSVIARPTRKGKGFKGVYHHWDGYPSGLGATLYEMFRTKFNRNLDMMLEELIDNHPAGWSSLNGDDVMCYCHGDNKGWAQIITNKNASACGCEYAYVLEMKDGEPIMTILSSYCDPKGKHAGHKMIGAFGMGDAKGIWKPFFTIKLNEDVDHDWERINFLGGG